MRFSANQWHPPQAAARADTWNPAEGPLRLDICGQDWSGYRSLHLDLYSDSQTGARVCLGILDGDGSVVASCVIAVDWVGPNPMRLWLANLTPNRDTSGLSSVAAVTLTPESPGYRPTRLRVGNLVLSYDLPLLDVNESDTVIDAAWHEVAARPEEWRVVSSSTTCTSPLILAPGDRDRYVWLQFGFPQDEEPATICVERQFGLDVTDISQILAKTAWDRDGRLTLWSSTQSTHYVARTVSMVTGLPEHRVRVIMPRVGGGFGPKAAASSMELATCFLALKTGRQVKTTFTREQVFWHSRARHQFFHEMTLGVDRQGKLLFLDHEAVLDGGAYASFGIATVYYAGSLLGAPYRLPAMRYKGVRAVTNKPASGAQRGHGGVIARALFEQQLDLIARDLGMDPVDLRLRNVMEAGDETVNNLAMSSLGMKECLEAVQKSSGWAAKRKGERAEGRGIGVACGFFVSGAGYPIYRSRTPHCTVEVKLDEVGGGVEVRSGAAEIGQGVETMLATVVAETLGIPVQRVRVRSGDSDLSLDLGAYSSRTTLMTGHAAREAAEGARAQLLDAAAAVLGVLASELEIRDDRLWVQGGAGEIDALRTDYIKEHRGWLQQPGGDHLTFTELSRLAFLELGTIVAVGRYSPPELGGKFKGAAVGTSPAYGCSAQVAEVQVDHETGEIQVQRITAAHDCGQAINRTQVEGQMQGCTSMGLGEALMEEVVFDEQGKVLNPTMADYKIPTALDMPPVDTLVIESDEPNGPFGAKEVGEGGIMPVIPAILNAIHDATGVTIDELPATPARILAGLGSEEQGTGDKE